MAKNEVAQNPFDGLWVLTKVQYLVRKNRWAVYDRFRFGDHIWFFREDDLHNGRLYEGRMMETIAKRDDILYEYSFSAEDAILHMNDTCDDQLWGYDTRRYRVVADRNKLTLYDHSENPDSCEFRLILRRDTSRNRLIEKLTFTSRRKPFLNVKKIWK